MTSAERKIILVGGHGLLGSSLAPYLQKTGLYEVISVSRSSKPSVDFKSQSEVNAFFNHLKPDIILNLAANTDVDLCETDPTSAYDQNYKIPLHISNWCEKNSKTHFVHFSTDMLYDNPGYNTESQIEIKNHYAGSKLAGELAIKAPTSTILRVNFFGKSLSVKRHSFTDWIFNQLSQKNKINIFDDVTFSPLSINTLCTAINTVLTNPVPGTYNLGAKTMLSKADFCTTFAQELFPESARLMTRIKLNDLKLKAPRPHSMAMDSTLFEKTFNFKRPTLEEEINLVLADYGKINEKRNL